MTTKPESPSAAAVLPPDPEVSAQSQRRSFSAATKLRILDELDRAKPGDIGAILRREGLYSSNVTRWRRQRDAGTLGALAVTKPGPKSPSTPAMKAEVERLERENARLRERLTRAEAVIELQKKLSEVLGLPLITTDRGASR